MTLGPRKYYRCTNKPSYIARENEPGPDGQYGSMSLCRECRMIMVKKILDGELTNITIAPIGAT